MLTSFAKAALFSWVLSLKYGMDTLEGSNSSSSFSSSCVRRASLKCIICGDGDGWARCRVRSRTTYVGQRGETSKGEGLDASVLGIGIGAPQEPVPQEGVDVRVLTNAFGSGGGRAGEDMLFPNDFRFVIVVAEMTDRTRRCCSGRPIRSPCPSCAPSCASCDICWRWS
jgi:hypothetical protein